MRRIFVKMVSIAASVAAVLPSFAKIDDIEIGEQYTFHIGLDLSSVYHKITFAPSVGDWETKIYENNDTF